MQFNEIKNTLTTFTREGKSMFVTSSFQTQSLVLLHIISRIDSGIPVFFLNTGYHFPETIVHKNKVADLLGINVIDLVPQVPKNLQRDAAGNLLFTFDPDYCCYLNKIQPVEKLLEHYDIWINGVRADQSKERSRLEVFQPTGARATRYHPMLDWSETQIAEYINKYDLPVHPLEAKGYRSIGCEPCTQPVHKQNSREGRWYGMKKKDCGLHTEPICCKPGELKTTKGK